VKGRGEASDGQIRAVAMRGRLESLEFDPRVKRLSGEKLSELTLTAVNAALLDLRTQAPSASDSIDLRGMFTLVQEVQNEGLRTMSMFTRGLSDAVAQVQERTGKHGDSGPHGLEQLLDQVQHCLGPVQQFRTEDAGPVEVRGQGQNASGLIRSVVDPGGRVISLEIPDRAMRMASEELAEHVLAAVNSALDDLKDQSREQAGFAAIDPRRIQELQEMSRQQMATYLRSLRDLVTRVQEP
jgi:DNA-binding protein YbaB